jgi:hypothetical protein
VKTALDRRQRDVNDRGVQNDHGLCNTRDDDDQPWAGAVSSGAHWNRSGIRLSGPESGTSDVDVRDRLPARVPSAVSFSRLLPSRWLHGLSDLS